MAPDGMAAAGAAEMNGADETIGDGAALTNGPDDGTYPPLYGADDKNAPPTGPEATKAPPTDPEDRMAPDERIPLDAMPPDAMPPETNGDDETIAPPGAPINPPAIAGRAAYELANDGA